VDAARTAVRLGAKQVTLLSEKPRNEMACSAESVDAAEAEGVPLQVLARPVRLEARADGQLTLHWEREGAPCSTQASCVIAAPERGVETSLVQALGVDVSRQGIAVDRKTLATNLPGVFAGGDVVSGPSTAVRAVAAGHLAALSIHQHLTGQAVTGEPSAVNVHMGTLSEPELAALFRDVEKCSRVRQAALGMPQRRTSFAEVVQGLTEEDAVEEARRCLQCDCLAREDCKLRRYATEYGADPRRFRGERRRFDRDATHPQVVYESGKCILCGLCVRIAEQSGEKPGVGFMRRGFAARVAVPFGASLADGLSSAAVRCATACPTGALALKRQKRAKEEDATGLAAKGA
jgi:formate dehydrogenase major subunit